MLSSIVMAWLLLIKSGSTMLDIKARTWSLEAKVVINNFVDGGRSPWLGCSFLKYSRLYIIHTYQNWIKKANKKTHNLSIATRLISDSRYEDGVLQLARNFPRRSPRPQFFAREHRQNYPRLRSVIRPDISQASPIIPPSHISLKGNYYK